MVDHLLTSEIVHWLGTLCRGAGGVYGSVFCHRTDQSLLSLGERRPFMCSGPSLDSLLQADLASLKLVLLCSFTRPAAGKFADLLWQCLFQHVQCSGGCRSPSTCLCSPRRSLSLVGGWQELKQCSLGTGRGSLGAFIIKAGVSAEVS